MFINPGKVAICADRVNVSGDVFLCKGSWGRGKGIEAEGFRAEGEVRLVRAVISGDLNCIGGKFCNCDYGSPTWALAANGLNIKGSLFLSEGFRADGRVGLVGTAIGGNLECNSGEFMNRGGVALDAERLKVDGDVFLCEGCWRAKNPIPDGRFKVIGYVQLIGATVGGSVKCKGASFASIERGISSEINRYGATINRQLVWTEIVSPEKVRLDLRFAKVKVISDDVLSWPAPGNLRLHELVYDEISFDTDQISQAPERRLDCRWLCGFLVTLWNRPFVPFFRDIKKGARIEWLRLKDKFYPQPYEQLAAILRRSGRDNDAKKVLIAKAADRAMRTDMPFFDKCWHNFWGIVNGYGYRPRRALWFSALVIAFGAVIFSGGRISGFIMPNKVLEQASNSADLEDAIVIPHADYPELNGLVYSLDMFVPLVDLGQASRWRLSTRFRGEVIDGSWELNRVGRRVETAGLLRLYTWFHIILGWILTPLVAVGFKELNKG